MCACVRVRMYVCALMSMHVLSLCGLVCACVPGVRARADEHHPFLSARGCLFSCMLHACFRRKSPCPCARVYGVHVCMCMLAPEHHHSALSTRLLFLRANGSRPARPFGRVQPEAPQAPTLPSMHANANAASVETISFTPTPVHSAAVWARILPPSAHTPHHASARAGVVRGITEAQAHHSREAAHVRTMLCLCGRACVRCVSSN